MKTIVFDLDGTLVDTADDLINTLSWLMQQEGLPAIDISQATSLIGAGIKPMIGKALAAHGRDDIDAVYAKYLVKYEEDIVLKSKPYPHILEQLQNFKNKGFRLAVCTNKLEYLARIMLDKLDMTHYFHAITGSDTFAFKKPDARHLLETIKMAGGNPLKTVMIGDSKTDIHTAQNANIPVIGYTLGYTDIPLIDLNPSLIINSYANLYADCERLLNSH
jgi:phosphoglycolate phosphatase